MAHCVKDYQTKKAMVEDVKAGRPVRVEREWLTGQVPEGNVAIEGPHNFHKWYASVVVKDGLIVKVRS